MMFMNLVRNELMKINSKRQSWMFFLFLTIIVILLGFVLKYGVGVLDRETNYLKFMQISFMGLNLLVLMFSIIVGAQTISDEFKEGTIKQLLIRPASRLLVLLSKYTACVVITLAALALLFIASMIVGCVLFGVDEVRNLTFFALIKMYLYNLPYFWFIMTVSFFMATVFKSSPLAIITAVITSLVGGSVVLIFGRYQWSKYLIFSNTDLAAYDQNPMVNQGSMPLFPDMTLMFSLTIIVIYLVALFAIAATVFQKRDVG